MKSRIRPALPHEGRSDRGSRGINPSIPERIGILIRAEALARGGNVRNKAIGPIRDGQLNRSSRPYTKTLWDD
jgi:hypothetical protein